MLSWSVFGASCVVGSRGMAFRWSNKQNNEKLTLKQRFSATMVGFAIIFNFSVKPKCIKIIFENRYSPTMVDRLVNGSPTVTVLFLLLLRFLLLADFQNTKTFPFFNRS